MPEAQQPGMPKQQPGMQNQNRPAQTQKTKKPFYKKWWVWAIAVVVILAIGGMVAPKSEQGVSTDTSGTSQSTPAAQDSTSPESSESTAPEAVPATEPEPDVPAEYKSALIKAKSYSDTMYMSKQGLYDQLTSEYGEKFSPEAAQYAIDNVEADWNANALAKAKQYQDQMAMSPSAIHDQLTSEYGEQFTQEEADYALANL